MKPFYKNACAGYYDDWLEVNLLKDCNASCPWCVEKIGWHPSTVAPGEALVAQMIGHKAKNIMLLGGEPTLHPCIQAIISQLANHGKNVHMTTNGALLSYDFVSQKLQGLSKINISIHHYDLDKNKAIIGKAIDYDRLKLGIATLQSWGTEVRLNCNCIHGYIDNNKDIIEYLQFAKRLGVRKVRFAELKLSNDQFVDLIKLRAPELPRDPYAEGCSNNIVMCGVHVNFRTMCGFQTPRRSKPKDPEQTINDVLYYDGNFYNGWQVKGEQHMEEYLKKSALNGKDAERILKLLEKKVLSVNEAVLLLQQAAPIKVEKVTVSSEGGCRY